MFRAHDRQSDTHTRKNKKNDDDDDDDYFPRANNNLMMKMATGLVLLKCALLVSTSCPSWGAARASAVVSEVSS